MFRAAVATAGPCRVRWIGSAPTTSRRAGAGRRGRRRASPGRRGYGLGPQPLDLARRPGAAAPRGEQRSQRATDRSFQRLPLFSAKVPEAALRQFLSARSNHSRASSGSPPPRMVIASQSLAARSPPCLAPATRFVVRPRQRSPPAGSLAPDARRSLIPARAARPSVARPAAGPAPVHPAHPDPLCQPAVQRRVNGWAGSACG